MKRYLKCGVLFLCLLAAAAASLFYVNYSSNQIYKESKGHLEEVYTQIKTSIVSITINNWRILHEWENYVALMAESDPRALTDYIDKNQKERNFTEFYFLSKDGDYMTVRGEYGYLNLANGLRKLMLDQENVVVDSVLPSGEKIIVFAVPVEEGTYGNFVYSAIAVSYTEEAMSSSLEIEAFAGQSVCYMAYQDGRILVASQSEEAHPSNFITYLQKNARILDSSLADIMEDWVGQVSGVIRYQIDNADYYLSYQPLGFSNWMLLGIVPVQTVNAVMNQYTLVTLLVMALVFLLVTGCVIALIFANSRKSIRKKNIELQSREMLFDILAQNTNDLFILFSGDTYEAEYVSPNIEKLLGLGAEDLHSDVRALSGILAEGEPALTEENLERASKDIPWVHERVFRHQTSGEICWFKGMMYRASMPGEDNRFIITLSDRTQERKMNQALEEALNAAKAANDSKRNFLANMSHDIRTPMNAIVGFSSLLSQEADKPDKVQKYARKISSSSQHLLSLINDILDMSKIESGKTSLNNIEFSLPQLLDEIMEMLSPQAKVNDQTFELRTKGVLPDFLLGDKVRLKQILINLLSNALKYTQKGGQIQMSVEAMGQEKENHAHLRFVVADNGFGMSQEFLQHIFDPFARERKMHAHEIQGTGLGMPITNNLVNLMGGTIGIQSELDKGSVFTVDLTFALADHAQDVGFWSRYGIDRVLVVDDEEDVCLDIQLSLRGSGVEVDYATNGYQAVEMASEARHRNQAYNAILLDWKMPGLDGQETARLLREKIGTNIPILMLTAYNADDLEESAMAAGVDKFLPKPFFLSYFQVALSAVLGQKKTRLEKAPQSTSFAGMRVLAAEDYEFNADLLIELLKVFEISCDMASNGKEALDWFLASESGYYDLIIMDIQMPVMDGYEATRQIRSSDHPDAGTIPIVAMTANAFEDDIKAALDAGMTAHTSKPVGKDKLQAIIQQYCGKKKT